MKSFWKAGVLWLTTGLLFFMPEGPAQADIQKAAPAVEDQADSTEAPYVRADVSAYMEYRRAKPRPPMTLEFLAMLHKAPPGMVKPGSTGDLPVGELG